MNTQILPSDLRLAVGMLFLTLLCCGLGTVFWSFINPDRAKLYPEGVKVRLLIWNRTGWKILFGLAGTLWFITGLMVGGIAVYFFIRFLGW